MTYMPTQDVTRKVDLLRTGAPTVWNIRTARHLGRRLQMYRPDVVHFRNLFQLQTGLGDGNRAELCRLT
jgi:hypothetical protein